MKVLRAIGAFFAKIGRWIANTAWIQPLLIVGGIFGIIFSIPYIKQGIENAQKDTTDYDYEYYKSKSLGLATDGRADKLLGYLENEEFSKINDEFGTKFFLTFVKKDCAYCKESVEGFKYLEANYKSLDITTKPVIYSVLVDKKNDDDEYMAQKLFDEHNDYFNNLAGDYGENDKYVLYENVPSKKSDYQDKIKKLPEACTADGEGIDTPLTLMYDYAAYEAGKFSTSGVTAVLFNYVDLVSETQSVTNKFTKATVLRDCWNYGNVFDPEYLNNK